jgi:predicted metal-dependent HD superfamily phosphohydrolase
MFRKYKRGSKTTQSTVNNFTDLWTRIGAVSDAGAVHNDLLQRYREPQRFYHNINHIYHCLLELSCVRSFTEEPDIIETSI